MPVVPLRVGVGKGGALGLRVCQCGGKRVTELHDLATGRGSRGAPKRRAEEEGGRLNRGLDTRPNVQIGQQRMARAHVSVLFSCSACPVLDRRVLLVPGWC